MKRQMMAAVALALLASLSSATAGLSIEDRDLTPEQREAGYEMAAIMITILSSMVYVYDKHCELLPKEFADDTIVKGLSGYWGTERTERSMKDMEDEYRKI